MMLWLKEEREIAGHTMSRLVSWRTATLLCIITGSFLWIGAPNRRAQAFIATWESRFGRCGSLREIRSLPEAELIYVREFPTGEWVAARSEHSCCSGAGFDATVFYDSAGAVRRDTSCSFCGYEGLKGRLDQVQARSLAQFYGGLHYLRLAPK